MARPLMDTDLGFHLKGGQWISEHLRVPTQDTYTYTVSTHDYLDIHWLYQVCLYTLYRLGGYTLLAVANMAFLFSITLITWKRMRLTGAAQGLCVLVLMTVLVGTEFRFRARPETLSWLFMVSTLWVLELRAKSGRNLLFLLPLIQIAWANVEGLFPIGWGIMAFFTVSDYYTHRKFPRELAKYSLLSIVAGLLNPNFIRGWLFPFTNLLRSVSIDVFKKNIEEFQSPWSLDSGFFLASTHYILAYKLFSCALLFLVVATFRYRKIHELLLALVFFLLSIIAVRNIPLFLLACAPLLAKCWKEWGSRGLGMFSRLRFSKTHLAGILTLFLIGFCLRVATGAYYASDQRTERVGVGLDSGYLPVKACEFLIQNGLNGNLLNQFGLGGWLDWKGPAGKTFIDGRLEVMGPEFFNEYNLSFKPGGLRALAEKYGAEVILLRPSNTLAWVNDLRTMPEWRLVYLDPSAAIFLKNGYGVGVPSLVVDRLTADYGIPDTILSETPILLGTSPPSAWSVFWEGFIRPEVYPVELLNLGLFAQAYGHAQMAESFYLEGIRRTQGRYYEFYYNLGMLDFQNQNFQESLFCMELAQKVAPFNPATLAALHNSMGMALLRLGYPEKAVGEFRTALVWDGHFEKPHENLWEIDEHLGQHEEAVEEMREALRINPLSSDDLRCLGTSYTFMKRYADAEDAFQKAYDLDPYETQNLINLATILQWERKVDESLALYQKGIERSPGEAVYYLKIADLYLDQGQKSPALGMLNAGLALNPTNPKVVRQMGEDYERLGKESLAHKCLQRAAALTPSTARSSNPGR
jgi:tetratricopeptide (TPR) repeat protein